ncbi:MAG: GAF domain-containing protein [Chloroflexi bacterium]|nr:GAF domain-containing protein [Chloroflexota bacterium]
MNSAPPASHRVPASTRDGWRSFEHRVLKRRAAGPRALHRRRPAPATPVRDGIETRLGWARIFRFLARLATLALAIVAAADLVDDAPGIRLAALIGAVLVAGMASLLAVAAAEPDGIYPAYARRWHLQAVASAVVMFMLMANATERAPGDLLWFLIVVGAASTLVAMATSYRDEGGSNVGGVCLAFDSAIVGFTTALITISVASTRAPSGSAAVLLGAFAAAGYAVAVATRPAIRLEPRGPDALFLGGVLVLCLNAAGEAAHVIGLGAPALLAAPGVALFGTLGLARSAWRAPRRPPDPEELPVSNDTRLSLVPAVAAVGAIVMLSWLEIDGRGTRAAFFGIITLFGLVVGRLLLTLVQNRSLLQRVEQSGLFEEKLRDLGGALVAALDRKNTLELVCRTAQLALATDSVLLWMLDLSSDELEAVEVLSTKRDSLLGRRLSLDEPTALAARVARTGAAEIVSGVPSANASNGFLNVVLRAQALLAVPVVHRGRVQGVLVCVDARNPAAYGPRELAKAELLASQVAVALDNAYQHALQQRRLEELTALYEFAQSAHTAFSAPEIMRQLLPILRERLDYASCTIWLREEATGTLRIAASDGQSTSYPGRWLRPSSLAMRAFVTGEPGAAGLNWDEAGVEADAPRSQLVVPMVLKRRVVGVVDLESGDAHAWSSTDERLLVALANHAALAVDNLHLLDETRKVAALRELDRMKTELLGTVSHELRTPLGSIKGYATTLLTHGNKLRKDEQREFLEIIDSEADRLRDLIENLLDLSRLEAGVLRIDRQPTRLGNSVREVVRKVELASPTHAFVLEWPADDPMVNADQKRIYQVIQNLMTNAVKYSPDGGCITVSGRVERRELAISVADEGLGIPEAEIDKIFDRFHRVQTEVSRNIGGTGLGLAICKGLVEAHGGQISASSAGESHGSTFSFTLPLLVEALDVSSVPATPSRSKGAHDHQEANRPRRR